MPTPRSGESKQEYLGRCTKQLVSSEGKDQKQAFAICNSYWEKEKGKATRSAVNLSAPITFQEQMNQKQFMINAYTGKVIETWFGRLVFDIDGIETKEKFPVIREHDRTKIVGTGTEAWAENNNYFIRGDFSGKTKDSLEVQELAAENFPWQASVGIWPKEIKVLKSDKEKISINGQELSGPLEVWSKSKLGEVSFVALGADDDTAAIILSDEVVEVEIQTLSYGGQNMDITELKEQFPCLYDEVFEAGQKSIDLQKKIEEAEKLERDRVTAILAVENAPIEAKEKAIKEGLSVAASYKLFWEADQALKAKGMETLKNLPDPVAGAGKSTQTPTEDFMALARKKAKEDGIKLSEAIKILVREKPELHQAMKEKNTIAKS